MRSPSPLHHRRSHQSGVVAIVVALDLASLLGVAALVVDLGYAGAAKAQLQAAVDSGAHAGALALDGTSSGLTRARTNAAHLALANRAAGRAVDVDMWSLTDEGGLQLGTWDADAGGFAEATDPKAINAVRVVATRVDLPSWFAHIFGHDRLGAGAEAVAVQSKDGAGEVDCFLPLAVAGCLLDRYGEEGVTNVDLVLNPAGIDNVGWMRPETNPSASWLRDQINDCQGDGTLAVEDGIDLGTGTDASVLKTIANEIAASPTTWDTSGWGALPTRATRSDVPVAKYGHTLEGPIAVFDDPDYCSGSGGGFTEVQPVVGFVWAAIYDVVSTGPAAGKNIRVRLDTKREHTFGTETGGPDWGITAVRIALAR